MVKTDLLVFFTILLLLLDGSTFLLAERGESPPLGVDIGDRFNLLVTDLPERPSVSQGGDPPAGVNFTQLFTLNLDNFTLRPIIYPLPPVGTSISLNITKIPNNSSPGVIRYNISQNYTDISSKFVLGEPVVSTDWERWIEVINEMDEKQVIDNKTITILNTGFNDTYFSSVLLFEPEIPASIKFMVSTLEIKQTLGYFVSSGIRDLIKVEITIKVLLFGSFVSTTSLKYISNSYNPLDNYRTTSSNSSPDFFPILLIPIIIFVPAGLILYFKRYKKSLLPKK